MKVDVKLEYNDYLKFNLWCIFRRKTTKIWLFIFPLFSLVYCVYIVKISLWFALGIIIFVMMLWIFSILLSTRNIFKTQCIFLEVWHYDFTESGIEMNSEYSSGKTAWKNIYEILETKSYFLIFISKVQAYILPKRCFTTYEEIVSFRQLLRNYGAKEKAKLKEMD